MILTLILSLDSKKVEIRASANFMKNVQVLALEFTKKEEDRKKERKRERERERERERKKEKSESDSTLTIISLQH